MRSELVSAFWLQQLCEDEVQDGEFANILNKGSYVNDLVGIEVCPSMIQHNFMAIRISKVTLNTNEPARSVRFLCYETPAPAVSRWFQQLELQRRQLHEFLISQASQGDEHQGNMVGRAARRGSWKISIVLVL